MQAWPIEIQLIEDKSAESSEVLPEYLKEMQKLRLENKESANGMPLSTVLGAGMVEKDENLKKLCQGNWKGLFRKGYFLEIPGREGKVSRHMVRGYEIRDKEAGKLFALLISE